MKRMVLRASLGAMLALVVLPTVALAHPLGNFTVNHFARVSPSAHGIDVHWVLDMAEIPAFSVIRAMDIDHDGSTGPDERTAWLDATLPEYLNGLALTVDGRNAGPWRVVGRNLSFPSGQGGLPTLRLELELAVEAERTESGAVVRFHDRTFSDQIGWREIVAQAGSGVRIEASDVAAASVSDELRRYPPDAATSPLDMRQATLRVVADDAVPGADLRGPGSASTGAAARGGDPLADLAAGELTPMSAVLAVIAALGLGAIHGVSPGHGKTLVAGYLIGSRGTMRQAVWLGVTVAVSHTIGVLLLGAVALAATALLLPERIIEWLALGSALLVIGLGGSLAFGQLRRGRLRGDHRHPHPHPHGAEHAHPDHQAPSLTTGALAALGIVGGIVPSASAILVLLVAVSLHRLAFGLVLIGAFGLGMAIVLAGISASVVVLRGRLSDGHAAWTQRATVRRIGGALPLASAVVVVAIGIVLTVGAAASLA